MGRGMLNGLDSVPWYGVYDRCMTIGQVAKAAGVGVETIRFYERNKLIPQPKRSTTGYRAYDQQIAQRVRFIRRAQELGFSLAEVRQLLALRLDPRRGC